MNTNEKWQDIADKLYEQHKGKPDVYAQITNALLALGYFYQVPYQTAKEKIRARYRHMKRVAAREQPDTTQDADDLQGQILERLKSGTTVEELSVKYALPELAVKGIVDGFMERGYAVEQIGNMLRLQNAVFENQEPTVLNVNWKGNKTVRFGLVGDTHINSKYTQLTHLHDMYALFAREGIKHVYHTGDIDDGEQMRPGHQYECYEQGADAHVAEIVRIYPKHDGMTTHFITGNHDASLIKRAGYNIGHAIARERADMDYLGSDCAIVMLTPNCSLELRHPWDGSAYALSYKPQKIIESLSGGEKTNIMAIGHYHKAEYLFYRNVHCFQSGTTCAQTPFMKGKAISAHMGGWLVEIEVTDSGHIKRIKPEFIPYYTAIPNDYMNWR